MEPKVFPHQALEHVAGRAASQRAFRDGEPEACCRLSVRHPHARNDAAMRTLRLPVPVDILELMRMNQPTAARERESPGGFFRFRG